MSRSIRVSLNTDELGHIVGALRIRIDEYAEIIGESEDDEDSWYEHQLGILVPLERRLTQRGNLK